MHSLDAHHGSAAKRAGESDATLFERLGVSPLDRVDEEGRFALTPEIVRRLLSDAGVYEFGVGTDGTFCVDFVPDRAMPKDESDLLLASVTESLIKDSRLSSSLLKGEPFNLYGPLLIDPDKHNKLRDIRTGDLVQLARNEILPIMLANTVGITGEEYSRGEEGFDVVCISPRDGETERIQLKLVRGDSPLLSIDQESGRRKFFKLVSLLTAGNQARPGDKALLIQDGASSQDLSRLVERLTRHGAKEEQVLVLSQELMAAFGMRLLDERRDDGRRVLFRLDLLEQTKAIIAGILLDSLDRSGADLLRSIEGLRHSARSDALLGILESEGVLEKAVAISADRARWRVRSEDRAIEPS